MVTIQALKNLRLRSADGVLDLPAGTTVELPQERVDVLLRKIPEKIRVLHPGFVVTWRSPLFGLCSGMVTEVRADAVVIGCHSVTKEPTTIPSSWITQIERVEP